MMRHPGAIDYRPDVDGLRAVAVLAVVFFHAFPAVAPGGFVGVDVFFVISGYLITSIILREHDEGTFTLWRFYARRVRRLFPALLLVLAATAIIGWYTLLPHEFRHLGRHLLAGIAYVSNFVLKQEAGYFDAGADEKPLLHLWSLAVEEQFYLVWPVLLLLVPRRHLFKVLLAILVASFVSNIANIERRPSSSFYLPQNRFWELALGAVLAFATVYRAHARSLLPRHLQTEQRWSTWGAHIASLGGMLLIAYAVFKLNRTLPFPGWWALLPCLGAALVIAAGPSALLNRYLLGNPLAVGIGLISYPLYLWHWPLLSFASITGHEDSQTRLTLVFLAAALSAATFFLFERPLRRSSGRVVVGTLFAASLVFGLVGAAGAYRWLEPRQSERLHYELSNALNDWGHPTDTLQRGRDSTGQIYYRTRGDAPSTIMYMGDSDMEQYWPRVERIYLERRLAKSIIFLARGGCSPVPKLRHPNRHTCKGFIEAAQAFASDTKLDTIVLGALWISYFTAPSFFVEGAGPLSPGNEAWKLAFSGLRDLVKEWRAKGKTVWIILDMPTGAGLAPNSQIRRSFWGVERTGVTRIERAGFERQWAPVRQELVAIASETGAGIIDPMQALCTAEFCNGELPDGTFIYKDARHLRASWVRAHADFIDRTLLGKPLPSGQ